jgi:hypothetical protein
VIPCAYLRVYQPLDAFPHDERVRWERYIITGTREPAARPRYLQRATTGRLGLMAPADGDHAEVRIEGGEYFVCPWRTRLRVLASLLSFREVSPLELSEEFVPEAEARRAEAELAKIRRGDPQAVSFIQQSPWHVPIRWFTLFVDEERTLTDEPEMGFRLRYLTRAGTAMGRARHAMPPLRRADLDAVADMLAELNEWLSAFDLRALLELDYGTLSDLFSWNELEEDHSARDIQDALEALSKGEFPRSADLYQGVLGRWAEVRSREQLN